MDKRRKKQKKKQSDGVREACRLLVEDRSLREERLAFELPAPPHHAQGDLALGIMTGIDLALAALDVSGIDQGVFTIGVPSCRK